MSKGYGRNATNEIVKNIIKSGNSYVKAYEKFKLKGIIKFSCETDAFSEALKKLAKTAVDCAKAMGVLGTIGKEFLLREDREWK